jgi:hypothetical protein
MDSNSLTTKVTKGHEGICFLKNNFFVIFRDLRG